MEEPARKVRGKYATLKISEEETKALLAQDERLVRRTRMVCVEYGFLIANPEKSRLTS